MESLPRVTKNCSTGFRQTLYRSCQRSLKVPLIHLGTEFNVSRTQSLHIPVFFVFLFLQLPTTLNSALRLFHRRQKILTRPMETSLSRKSQMIWHSVGEIQVAPFVFVSRFIIHCFCLTLYAVVI